MIPENRYDERRSGGMRILSIVLLTMLIACGRGEPTFVPSPPESKLSAREYAHFVAAMECLALDAVEPAVEYEQPIRCPNNTRCCAAGCAPVVGQSCYWLDGNRIVMTSNESGTGCANVDAKLHVEMANAVGWQNGDFRDQFYESCGRM